MKSVHAFNYSLYNFAREAISEVGVNAQLKFRCQLKTSRAPWCDGPPHQRITFP